MQHLRNMCFKTLVLFLWNSMKVVTQYMANYDLYADAGRQLAGQLVGQLSSRIRAGGEGRI